MSDLTIREKLAIAKELVGKRAAVVGGGMAMNEFCLVEVLGVKLPKYARVKGFLGDEGIREISLEAYTILHLNIPQEELARVPLGTWWYHFLGVGDRVKIYRCGYLSPVPHTTYRLPLIRPVDSTAERG